MKSDPPTPLRPSAAAEANPHVSRSRSEPAVGPVPELQRQLRPLTTAAFLSFILHTLAVGGMIVLTFSVPSRPPPLPVTIDLTAGKIIPLPEGMLAGPLPIPGPGDVAQPPPPDDTASPPPADAVASPPPPESDMAAAAEPPSESEPVAVPPSEPVLPPPPEPQAEPVAAVPVEPETQPQPLPETAAGAPVKPVPAKPVPAKAVAAKPVTPEKTKPTPKPTVKALVKVPLKTPPKPALVERVSAKVPTAENPRALAPAEIERLRTERIRRDFKATPNPLAALGKLPTTTPSSLPTTDPNAIATRIGSGIRNETVTVRFAGGTGRTGGGSGSAGTGGLTGTQAMSYFDSVQARLHALWAQPTRGEERTGHPKAIVMLTILADGTVREARLTERSRSNAMNSSIETLLRTLRRLPAPAQFGVTEPSITIRVVFELDP